MFGQQSHGLFAVDVEAQRSLGQRRLRGVRGERADLVKYHELMAWVHTARAAKYVAGMRSLAGLSIAVTIALQPAPVIAGSAWGSSRYDDPPAWCTKFSDMWTATVVTNDPLVGTNPEQDTFYGFHPNPGYDDWYGYFYGDFRGTPGDSSGWVRLLHENYPRHYHWNFATNGWAVHGHANGSLWTLS